MDILPDKHSDAELTLVPISSLILDRVIKLRIEPILGLKDFLVKKNKLAEPLFVPSLLFLHLLGLIEYRAKNDSIEYVGPK